MISAPAAAANASAGPRATRGRGALASSCTIAHSAFCCRGFWENGDGLPGRPTTPSLREQDRRNSSFVSRYPCTMAKRALQIGPTAKSNHCSTIVLLVTIPVAIMFSLLRTLRDPSGTDRARGHLMQLMGYLGGLYIMPCRC